MRVRSTKFGARLHDAAHARCAAWYSHTTTVEHQAVLDAIGIGIRSGVAEVFWMDVDAEANLRPESLRAALRANVDLVCVMAANNEVGTIYLIEEIARDVHFAGAKILVAGTQAVGRGELRVTDWDWTISRSAPTKIYGPKGVGALAVAGNDVRAEITTRVLGHDGHAKRSRDRGFRRGLPTDQLGGCRR